MGIYEKSQIPEYNVVAMNEKTDYSECKPQKLLCLPINKRTVLVLTSAFTLVIFALIVALIIVVNTTHHSADCVTETKTQNSAPCEDDWIWSRGRCYYFSNRSDTWENSEKFCTSHNASLALIENQEELDFLFRYKDEENHWIGMRRTADNTAWIWTNGASYNESLFQIKRLSPNAGNMERVFLNHKGVNSKEGTYEHKWICNKK